MYFSHPRYRHDKRTIFKSLGARMPQLRKQQNITQVQLAEALGISQQTMNAYEMGHRRVPVSALLTLAQALAVSVEELIGSPASMAAKKRGPDDELRMQLEAISEFDADEKDVALNVLEGLILKHQAKRAMQRLQPKNKKAS